MASIDIDGLAYFVFLHSPNRIEVLDFWQFDQVKEESEQTSNLFLFKYCTERATYRDKSIAMRLVVV